MFESTELIKTNNSINPHHIAIENPDSTCFNCLQKHPQIHEILIPTLNHSSKFTNFSSKLHLCDNCLSLTNPEWWKLEIIKTYSEYNMMQLHYKYEKEILDFINQMPLSGQELFYARFGSGVRSDLMRGQDWIDYALDKLSHEKCKEYGYYSPEERKAYKERFHICDKIKIVIYEDEDRDLRCPFGAYGNINGTYEGDHMHHQCYECKMFEVKDGEVEVMNIEDYEIYELENELALKMLLRENKNKENSHD